MEYAFYRGVKTAAQPGLKAQCPHCGAELIAKCGSKKIWHWAHTASENCDPWFEPETLWHRQWKNHFGENHSEIRLTKGEVYHIADAINSKGIIFEFQNSSISQETIQAREEFYGERMIWVLNGISFKTNFKTYDEEFLSGWSLPVLNEFEAAQNYKKFDNGLMIEDWRVKSDSLKNLLALNDFVYLEEPKLYYKAVTHGGNRDLLANKIYTLSLELYEQHKICEDFKKGKYVWEHFRPSWEGSRRPVFIDFGEDYLYRVSSNIGQKYGEGIKIKRGVFLEKYCTEE